jgi:hypothetical protein
MGQGAHSLYPWGGRGTHVWINLLIDNCQLTNVYIYQATWGHGGPQTHWLTSKFTVANPCAPFALPVQNPQWLRKH